MYFSAQPNTVPNSRHISVIAMPKCLFSCLYDNTKKFFCQRFLRFFEEFRIASLKMTQRGRWSKALNGTNRRITPIYRGTKLLQGALVFVLPTNTPLEKHSPFLLKTQFFVLHFMSMFLQ